MATVEKQLAFVSGCTLALVLDDVAKLITGVHVRNPNAAGTMSVNVTIGTRNITQTFGPGTDLVQPIPPQGYSEPIGPRGIPVFRASNQVTAVITSLEVGYSPG